MDEEDSLDIRRTHASIRQRAPDAAHGRNRLLLGEGAALSPATMLRLKADWQIEYEAWRTRSLAELDIVYLWADGLYVKAGLEDGKAALLVLIGADTEGQKHVLAIESGQRESVESWAAVPCASSNFK